MKKTLLIASAALMGLAMISCKKGFKTTDSGLQYMIYTSNEGPKAKEKDFLTVHITYRTESDSVLFDTRKTKPITFPMAAASFKGALEEGLAMLSAGDSATFLISADSLFEKTFHAPIPEYVKKGSKIKFDVKLFKIQSSEERQKEKSVEAEKYKVQESAELENYLKENNISVKPTPNGLYYISEVEGKGPLADSGKTVVVEYVGKFLDGKVFDESAKAGKPFEFVLGTGSVISGWDEGISMMRAGGKAKLVIPSTLAYGGRGVGDIIPPFAPLTFDVELKEIKETPKASAEAEHHTDK
jgi:FKBP-type peptidyl-prolyl cis-trans isomerase FkpA